MQQRTTIKVWVTPKFVDAHGKESTLYPDEVAVPEGSTLAVLVNIASKQLKDIIPPDTNRVIVRKFAARTLNTFVPVLAVRLSEAACEDGAQYEMQFLRPYDRLERHEEVSIITPKSVVAEGSTFMENYYAYALGAHEAPSNTPRKRRLREPVEQLDEEAKQPKLEREELSENAVDSLTDSDISSILRKVEPDRDDRCDSTVNEPMQTDGPSSTEAEDQVRSTPTCEGPADPSLRPGDQTSQKEPKHEPHTHSAMAATIIQVDQASLKADDENQCDTPPDDVATPPAADGSEIPHDRINDTVSAECVQRAPPSARDLVLHYEAIELPPRRNVAVTTTSVATSLSLDRSSIKVANEAKVADPVTANEARLRAFKLRVSDIIKKRFETHRSQLKPGLEDYKQFIRKLVTQVTEKELRTGNAIEVTDSVVRATKRYVDDWISVLRSTQPATPASHGLDADPRTAANFHKQPRTLRRSEVSTGCRRLAGTHAVSRLHDSSRSAERKTRTSAAARTRSKDVSKQRHERRSRSSRRESGKPSRRGLKPAPASVTSKKLATRSVTLKCSRNISTVRAKSPPRRNSGVGFTTWKDEYSTLFAPHVVHSDRGNAYYKCKLCNLDFLFGKQGSDSIVRHQQNWKHVSLAKKVGSDKTT